MGDLVGRRVLVVGLGLHGGGLGVTRFLLQQGAEVTVTDLRTAEELAPSLEALAGEPVRYVLGEHRLEDFLQADMVVRNPAVPRNSPYLEAARRRGIPVEMEMTLFFERCPGPILAVTGTKGKSTTTALLGELLRRRYPDVVVAGNIRVSALGSLPGITPETPVVLELSSWQLEGLEERGLCPHLAVVTNLYRDHMNRYASWEEYVRAKQGIYRSQGPGDLVVLNADDPIVRTFSRDAPGQVAWYGLDLHQVEGMLYSGDGEPLSGGRGATVLWDEEVVWLDQAGRLLPLYPRSQLRLPGRHNLSNALAATTAALLYGLAPDEIAAGIAAFEGLADRMEVLATLDGVTYINDTTSTAPAAAIAALQSLDGEVVLIAGGADKRLEYGEWAAVVGRRVRGLVLLEGSATSKMVQALQEAGCRVPLVGPLDDLREAVLQARALARPGDTVLFSPGCASFGLFLHEFDRGERFRQVVAELARQSEVPPENAGLEVS